MWRISLRTSLAAISVSTIITSAIAICGTALTNFAMIALILLGGSYLAQVAEKAVGSQYRRPRQSKRLAKIVRRL